jgi:hypothetical protein
MGPIFENVWLTVGANFFDPGWHTPLGPIRVLLTRAGVKKISETDRRSPSRVDCLIPVCTSLAPCAFVYRVDCLILVCTSLAPCAFVYRVIAHLHAIVRLSR